MTLSAEQRHRVTLAAGLAGVDEITFFRQHGKDAIAKAELLLKSPGDESPGSGKSGSAVVEDVRPRANNVKPRDRKKVRRHAEQPGDEERISDRPVQQPSRREAIAATAAEIRKRFSAAVTTEDVEAMHQALKEFSGEAGHRACFMEADSAVRAIFSTGQHGAFKALREILAHTLHVDTTVSMALHVHKAKRERLEKRVAILERCLAERDPSSTKSLADAYRGTYLAGTKYARGELLTHGGSLWLCMSDTQAVPGDSSDWRLVVKRGAAAK